MQLPHCLNKSKLFSHEGTFLVSKGFCIDYFNEIINNGLTVGHNVPHKQTNHTSVKVTGNTTLASKCSVDEKKISSNYVL